MLAGSVIYYRCQLQPTVALSSTEAEFVAMADAGKAALYLRSILNELGILQNLPTTILADNAGAIAIANAHQPTRRTKHVELKHFAILQWTDEDKLHYQATPTEFNIADHLTKPLGRIKFYEQTDILMGRRRPQYVETPPTPTQSQTTKPTSTYSTIINLCSTIFRKMEAVFPFCSTPKILKSFAYETILDPLPSGLW